LDGGHPSPLVGNLLKNLLSFKLPYTLNLLKKLSLKKLPDLDYSVKGIRIS
jgi:hypothetical protein